jgi:hypothetical protein
LDREILDILQQGIDEQNPILDITVHGFHDYAIDEIPERWQQMQILPLNPNPNPTQNPRVGGADSNLRYVGDDSEIRAYLERLGIGIETKESCFVYALRQANVSEEVLNQIAPLVKTQFLLVKQAISLLDRFHLNCGLRVWSPGRTSKMVRKAPCKDGTEFYIDLLGGHYFISEKFGKGFGADLIFHLLDAGLLVVGRVGDRPRREIQPPLLKAGPYDPDCVQHFAPLHQLSSIYDGMELPE